MDGEGWMAGIAFNVYCTATTWLASKGYISNQYGSPDDCELHLGWLDLTKGQLPLTSPFALFSNRGERERESLVYTFFSLHSTPQCKQQNGKVSGVVVIFLVSTYGLIV